MKITLNNFLCMPVSELGKLQILDLSNNDIGHNFLLFGDNFLFPLCAQLRHCNNLKVLNLSYNDLRLLGASRIHGLLNFVLNQGKDLQLNLSNNKLFTVDDAGEMIVAICEVIRNCLYITLLDLSSNGQFNRQYIYPLLSSLQQHTHLRFNFADCGVDKTLFFNSAAMFVQQSVTMNPLLNKDKPVFKPPVTIGNGSVVASKFKY